MVYGVIRQSGGYIWIHSKLGKGATSKSTFRELEIQDPKRIRKRTSGGGWRIPNLRELIIELLGQPSNVSLTSRTHGTSGGPRCSH